MDIDIKPSMFWGVIIALTMMLFMMVNFVWPDENYRTRTIDGDGRGYYDYLSTLLLHHTINFKNTFEYDKKNQPLEYQGHNFHKVDGVYINKFPVGTALLMLPFFLVALIVSPFFGLDPDGYSLLFQYEVAMAALWWLWVGVFFFRKLLLQYNIPEVVIIWVSVVLITATNLFHYAFVDVAFSHIYSFAIITGFLFFAKRFFERPERKYLAISALLFGLIVLIRPVNGLIVFVVPFFADDAGFLKSKVTNVVSSINNWIILIAFFVLGILPQLIINYLQTGNLIIYGYKGEGFYFLHPHIIDFLFGYKKGWFVYTPFMLLLFPALRALYRKSKYQFGVVVSFLVLLIYIFSSWWNWFYGDGFGMRPMVEYYALFVLIIALWVNELKVLCKRVVLVLSFLFVVLNMVQSYQYFKGIIHVDSMTKQAYWYQFMKVSDEYRNLVAPADEYFYGTLSDKPVLTSANSFEAKVTGWSSIKSLTSIQYKSPGHSQQFNDEVEYSSSFQLVANRSIINKKLYLILRTSYLETSVNAAKDALFVVDIRNKDNSLTFYKAFPIKRLPDSKTNEWQPSHIGLLIPKLNKGEHLKTYIWNKGKASFFIDDFVVSLYEIY